MPANEEPVPLAGVHDSTGPRETETTTSRRRWLGGIGGIGGATVLGLAWLGAGHIRDQTSGGAEYEVHGVELMLIPGGTFWMGTAEGDEQAYPNEQPRHEVTLSPFYLAKTPVTNAQYERYLRAKPNAKKPLYWGTRRFGHAQQPVVGISWDEAQAYCEWAGLVLPTEAQWEYACRAGTQTRYWSGDAEEDLTRVGWYEGNSDRWFETNSDDRPHVVAELPANPWGLHDMHGNVWEWCQDVRLEGYESPVRERDGLRHQSDDHGEHVFRGGSWLNDARRVRSAFRYSLEAGIRDKSIGFRPVQRIP